ncbi:MAG: antibiotic biosynthesis monooxygenase family protein [Tepidisphaeraceae bacterium]
MVLAHTMLVARCDQRVAFVNAGLQAVEQVRQEPGCLDCRMLHDVGGDGTFIVIEEWTSMTQLRRHFRGAGYRRMLALMEMSACTCAASFHTIRCTAGMELVHEALAKADQSP